MLHRLMEQLKNNKKSVFNHAAQIIILLVVIKYFYDMINPIIKVAQYSHPTMDDYWMTTYVHEQWLENHSVLGFIAAAFRYAIGIYKTWDGNFLICLSQACHLRYSEIMRILSRSILCS